MCVCSVHLRTCACMNVCVHHNEPSAGQRRSQRDVDSVILLILQLEDKIMPSSRPICSEQTVWISCGTFQMLIVAEAKCLTSRFKNQDAVASSTSTFCLASVLMWSFASVLLSVKNSPSDPFTLLDRGIFHTEFWFTFISSPTIPHRPQKWSMNFNVKLTKAKDMVRVRKRAQCDAS